MWLVSTGAYAQDAGAITNGNWNNAAIWTTGTVPGASNNVFIGSNYPGGAALSATVTLTQNQSAATLYLGYGAGTNGTLNLGANNLAATTIWIGQGGGTGTITNAGGSFTTQNMYLASGNSYTFGAADQVTSTFELQNASTATTAAAGNATGYVDVYSGSTLNVGANLNLSGYLDIENAGSTVHMNGHNLSANQVFLGWNSQAVTFDRGATPGTLTANQLYVNGSNFNPLTTDAVTNFYLNNATTTLNSGVAVSFLQLQGGATGTTTTVGNITSSANVDSASTLNLGANLSLTGNLDVEDTGSAVHMNGNNISANQIFLGWNDSHAVTLDRGATPGSLTTSNLYVYGSTFNLLPTDAVTNFYVSNGSTTLNSGVAVSFLQLQSGSTGTTMATGNITGSVNVDSASTLNLGANLSLTGNLDVENTGSTVHMNGHNISANQIFLGWNSAQAVTLDRGATPGSLTANYLYNYGTTFNLLPTDAVTNFYISNGSTALNSGVAVSYLQLQGASTGTTTTSGNITSGVGVYTGSTLNMGANLTLTGNMDVEDVGSAVHMNGHNISANQIYLGWNNGHAVTLDRGATPGSLSANYVFLYGSTLNLLPTDAVTNFYINNGSTTFNSGVAVSFLQLQGASTGTTTTSANITGGVSVFSGSTLNMGANLALTGNLDVEDNGSAVHMNGNNISANQIYLGWNNSHAVTLDRGATPGSLTANYIFLYGSNLNLMPTDSVTNFYLRNATSTLGSNVSYLQLESGSTAATTAGGNVAGNVYVFSGSTLNLGANLNLSGVLDVRNANTVVNGNGFNVSATQFFAGWNDTGTVTVNNLGLLNVSSYFSDHNSTVAIHGGVISSSINLNHSSILSVLQTNGLGLTLNGNTLGNLSILNQSQMDLIFSGTGWDFRWADPAAGNWVSTLNGMIASGEIAITVPQGDTYSVYDQAGYTYVAIVSGVPEPTVLALGSLAAVGTGVGLTWRRWRRRKAWEVSS
jgi:hypothetical protein